MGEEIGECAVSCEDDNDSYASMEMPTCDIVSCMESKCCDDRTDEYSTCFSFTHKVDTDDEDSSENAMNEVSGRSRDDIRQLGSDENVLSPCVAQCSDESEE
ncbi:MAG: hypothetical protein H6766_04785 [Candidatus Peribacteria bacterium]|nr:MAG: hypothetical protein H6766_04785 [Candidatus Peribacteria bacterium]